jgi:hypothetical protein
MFKTFYYENKHNLWKNIWSFTSQPKNKILKSKKEKNFRDLSEKVYHHPIESATI